MLQQRTALSYVLLIFAGFSTRAAAFVPCSTLQDCRYQGCAQAPIEGNFFGCNCAPNEVQGGPDGATETHCYRGDDDQPVESHHCVYSTNFGITFEHCPCHTSCPRGQYLDGCRCAACPPDHTCDGLSPPCPTSCSAGLYLDACQCKPCPTGSFCTQSTARKCKVCGNETFEAIMCTQSQDTTCAACSVCSDGSFESSQCSEFKNRRCSECTYCKENFYAETACTTKSDTLCLPCPPDHYCPGNQRKYVAKTPGSNIFLDPDYPDSNNHTTP